MFGAAVACGGSVGDCACLDLRSRGRFATVFDLLCDFSARRCDCTCLVLPSCVVRSAAFLALVEPCVVGSTIVLAGSRCRTRSVMRLCGVCFVVVVMVLLPCMTWFCGRYLPMGAYPFDVFFIEPDPF